MKAHKYLKDPPVISAVSFHDNMIGIPGFFTVTSPPGREIHEDFTDKLNKNDRKFHSDTGST